jgi:hypothetical protein
MKDNYQNLSEKEKKNLSEKMTGNGNSFYGHHHTKENKQKFSTRMSGENNPWFNKKRPEHATLMSTPVRCLETRKNI